MRRPPTPPPSTRIGETVVLRRQGKDVRVPLVEAIVERVRSGAPREIACGSLGIDRMTVTSWDKRGLRARDLREQGKPVPKDEQPFLAFSDALAQAEDEASLDDYTRLTALARGGQDVVVVREVYDAKGKLVTRQQTTEQTQANERVLMWRLKMRNPELFADRVTVEGNEDKPIPINHTLVAASLVDRLRQVQERARGDVIELPRASGNGSG